ncbi:hypothetical protein GWK47_028687 [Chionoecetes opilio]|uniref:Uncharacterized protein n=1 Tax=Chionoecetes opilio TaxID=41210 RepID=A0A8J4YLX4_CHIOP|nr:hypothetical protein GWK47_028687 [Chionoecetes opilio]
MPNNIEALNASRCSSTFSRTPPHPTYSTPAHWEAPPLHFSARKLAKSKADLSPASWHQRQGRQYDLLRLMQLTSFSQTLHRHNNMDRSRRALPPRRVYSPLPAYPTTPLLYRLNSLPYYEHPARNNPVTIDVPNPH